MGGDIQKIDCINNSQVAQNVNGDQIYIEKLFLKNESLQPLFSCKYYNFNDPYISTGIFIITLISLFVIVFNIQMFYVVISLSAILFILMQQRILNILQITNVYNDFFSINGILILFQNIEYIEIKGFKLLMTYKEEEYSAVLPKTLTFIKKDEIDKFQEQYNKSKSNMIYNNLIFQREKGREAFN
jgi:hypothetical protein